MSESMVEKVARAIRTAQVKAQIEADGFAVPTNPDWYADIELDDEDRAAARAAIAAMREPTNDMQNAAVDVGVCDDEGETNAVWRAMIEEALRGG